MQKESEHGKLILLALLSRLSPSQFSLLRILSEAESTCVIHSLPSSSTVGAGTAAWLTVSQHRVPASYPIFSCNTAECKDRLDFIAAGL